MARRLTEIVRGILAEAPQPQSDGWLLDRYVHEADSASFTALVQRHGPLVLHLCRRFLAQFHVVRRRILVWRRRNPRLRGRGAQRDGKHQDWNDAIGGHSGSHTGTLCNGIAGFTN